MLTQGNNGGAGDEGHVRQLDAVTLLVLRLLFFADLDDARHIHFEDGVDMRAGTFRLDHALRDDGAHLRHGHEFAGLGLWCRRLRGGRCRSGGWRSSRRSRSGDLFLALL